MIINNIIFGLPKGLANILIPTIVTIFLFFVGYLIAWIIKKFEKRNETKSYRELILEWIDLLEKPIKEQITMCKDFAKIIGSSQELQPEVFKYNNFLIEKIESIPIERYINTFVVNTRGSKKDKYEKTYNLISQFDYIKRAQLEMLSKYQEYHSGRVEMMDEWNENFISLNNIIMEHHLYNKSHDLTSIDEFHAEVMKFVVKWGQNSPNGQSSVSNSKIQLIDPLFKIVGVELGKNPMNDYAFNLDLRLQMLKITLRKMEASNSGNEVLFNNIAQNMQKSLESLLSAKEFFEKETKVRCVFYLR